jgi:hypothetical protein
MITHLVAASPPELGNNTSFVFAAVALLVAAVSPLLLAYYNRKTARKDKAEEQIRLADEKARQDEVAVQAAKMAAAMIQSNESVAETARRSAEEIAASNERVALITQQAATETAARLAAIHTLVNSNLTQAQERELDATRAMLSAMRDVVSMRQDRDLPVTLEALDAIKVIENRIMVMAGDLAHKEQLTRLAEKLLVEGIKSTLPPHQNQK